MNETSKGRLTEQEIQAEQAALWAAVPDADKALCKALYPALPADCNGMDDVEFYVGAAEALAAFREQEQRAPRAGAELDAWMNSADEFAAYLQAHPVQTAPSAPPVNPPDTSPPPVNPAPVEPQQSAEEKQAALLSDAESTRKAIVKAFRLGERSYRTSLLEAGRLSHHYLCVRMTLGHSRDAAVKTVEGDLNAISSNVMDVNRLIRCYWVWHLLCEAQGLEKTAADMAYGAYRDGWTRCIQATAQGKPEESYTLLPGMGEDCKSAFKSAAEAGLCAKDCADKAGELLRRYTDAAAAAKRVQEDKARQETERAKIDADKARLDKEAADRVTKDAERRLQETANQQKAATDKTEQDRLEQLRVEHEKELEKKRIEQADAQSAADAKERERLDAEKREEQAKKERAAADRAKDAQDKKAADKDKDKGKGAKREPSSVTVTGPTDCKQGEPLLVTLAKTAKSASSKDFGTMLAASIRSAEDPIAALADTLTALADQLDADNKTELGADDVLCAVLMALKDHKALSNKGKRALQAAHMVLSRKDTPAPSGPSPAELASASAPSANGLLVVAGS